MSSEGRASDIRSPPFVVCPWKNDATSHALDLILFEHQVLFARCSRCKAEKVAFDCHIFDLHSAPCF